MAITLTAILTSGCSKSGVVETRPFAQGEGADDHPRGGTAGEQNLASPAVSYDGACEDADGGVFGKSRRYVLRLYGRNGCPVGEGEKSADICLKSHPLALEREYFVGKGCAGERAGRLTRFFTLPEERAGVLPASAEFASAFGAHDSTAANVDAIAIAIAIDATSGPVILRPESENLAELFQRVKFCSLAWTVGENTEVTGKTCGANDPFLDAGTRVYSRWLRTENVIQFGALVTEEKNRPTELDAAFAFRLR